MRTALASALGMILLAGCNSPAENASAPVPTTTSAATSPVASAATTPSTPATSDKPKADDSSQKVNQDPRTGEFPSRINQLKDLKTATIEANGHKIRVWLMDNTSKREEGMMFLQDKDVHDNEGMLFLWPDVQPGDEQHGFWMKNCPLGLDICYISPKKVVLNVADGKPYNETSLPPAGAYQYVLEMKTNKAKKLGIKAGTQMTIPKLPSLPDMK